MGTRALIPSTNVAGQRLFGELCTLAQDTLTTELATIHEDACPGFAIAALTSPFTARPNGRGWHDTLVTDMLLPVAPPETFLQHIDRGLDMLMQKVAGQLESTAPLHEAISQLITIEDPVNTSQL